MNGNYDISYNNGNGFPPNTNVGFSENMLDMPADIFGRVAAAPLISQANLNPLNQPTLGYSQAYMQEMLVFKERCKALETQLMKVTTERDTLKMMLDQLSTSLQKTTTVPSVTKSAEMYPKVRFWTQTKYNEWTNTPEAHCNTRYKFAFIEDEQGNTVPDGTLKAIRKTVRGCWAELVVKGMAPKSWGRANASAKEVVYSLAYKSFPFLQLAESDWKMDLLCSLDYPGWVRNNLDDKGNWVTSRRVKQEDDAATGDNPASSMSKKRKAKAVKSELIEKKFKEDSATREDSPLATTPDICTTELPTGDAARPAFPTSLLTSPRIPQGDASKPSLHTLGSSVSVSGQSNLSSPPPTPVMDSNMEPSMLPALPQGDDVSKPLSLTLSSSAASVSGRSNLSPPPTPALDSNTELSRDHETEDPISPTVARETMLDSNMGPSVDHPLATEARTETPENATTCTPIVINPLSSLAKKSVTLKLPPLPPMPKVVAKDQNNGNGEGVGARGNSSNSKGKMTSNRKSKMRPTKNRTAYNLCALRWLAQINENGNCNEFRAYWTDQLSEQQREAYKNEAKELVEKNAWDNTTVSQGTLH